MTWQYRWQLRDPAEVYERMEERAQRETNKALTKAGEQDRAKQKLNNLFKQRPRDDDNK